MTTPRVPRTLTVTFDVSELSPVQVDSLALHVVVQAESYDDDFPDEVDGDRSYPDVDVVSVVVDPPLPVDPDEPLLEHVTTITGTGADPWRVTCRCGADLGAFVIVTDAVRAREAHLYGGAR